MKGRAIVGLAFLAALTGALTARADEIRLKDGTKIVGTIVGFESDSFKVETAYGSAVIRKDMVAGIIVSTPKKESEPKTTKAAPPPANPSASSAAAAKPPASDPAKSPATSPAKSATQPVERKAVVSGDSSSAATGTAAKKDAVPVKEAAAAPPLPAAAPEAPVIRDEIHGNVYLNHTYGFQMFKPPSWDVLPAARKAMPNAVAALGTGDETTMLIIGRENRKDSLDAQAAATGKALNEVYENYRLISSRYVTVAGLPAIEQRSRGTADKHDWSVVLLTLLHGNDAFTLLGMTWSDSDLIQVQENVIEKTVTSLTFVSQ